jgi:uncharacterized membrane protein YidH (DUF202 family)
MTESGSGARAGDPRTPGPARVRPGGAPERTVLSWTRSALNMAVSGTLIARAGFAANLDALGVATTITMAMSALLVWRHGERLYVARVRDGFAHRQPRALGALTAATLLTAALAIVVTIAL